MPPAAATEPALPAADAAPDTPLPLRRRTEVWLATTGAMVLLACAGAMFMAHVAAAPQSAQAGGAASLAAALRTSEFAALDARERADGQVALHGHLATQAQRTRLEAWLAAHQFTPALDVQVDEVIARDVTEVFRVNGVSVQARVVGPGRIAAEVADHDADRLARAEDAVRRDVRNLDALTVHNSAVPLPPPAPPVADDPAKRIASVVPGDPAYVVTVDGARYFVGALLPSGHRITQVAAQRITLERDGQQSTLNF
jgi:type III secretion protein D